jgi:hypothetical protein
MPYVLIRHTVADYPRWKRAFDGHGRARRSGGSKGGVLFRNAARPKEVFILLRWSDVRRAKKFAKSANLRKAMKGAGVRGRPEMFFLQESARTGR